MDCDNSTLMQQEVEFQPGGRIYDNDIPPAIALLQAQNLNYGFISSLLGELCFPKSSIGGV